MLESRTIELNGRFDLEVADIDAEVDAHQVILWQDGKILVDFYVETSKLPRLAMKLLEAHQG